MLMDPDDQPGGKRSGGRRARRSSATPQSSATIPATAKEFRSWVLASAPLVEQTTSLDRIEVDKALTAIITVTPNILTIRVLTDPPEVKPLDGCTANVCLGRSGPGGKEPCYQDTNCPSQTTCMTQACDGEACVGHQCGTLTCTEQGCNANYCNNNACTNNECESMDSPGCSGQSPDCAAQVVAPCEGHSCP
ncbi:MAG TPA: hypothetical protein PKE45_05005, partial [Caldilineaceae bacterium]|nr:hypothetical protein [Caldilineaceae bacterium]